ncbi:hypothetical protein Pmani_026469 [Petrolisthes manimaculis]|uniref:Uncharacterized protein n=1 Tax=Petrolisthes manimaculis TaxID=1843537 RepID=A0AAE1P604_9EUCA|nr:hypothetical protein Pmani_026469 [Petrolisthes manimaculis]
MAETAKIAAQNAEVSVSRYKSYFHIKSQDRKFQPGDEVLLLLSSDSSKLLVAWQGPYKVLERKGKLDYLIDNPKGPRLYHANLLKRYFRRSQVNFAEVLDEIRDQEEDASGEALSCSEDPKDEYIHLPVTPDGQLDVMDVQPPINPNLGEEQRTMLCQLLTPPPHCPAPLPRRPAAPPPRPATAPLPRPAAPPPRCPAPLPRIPLPRRPAALPPRYPASQLPRIPAPPRCPAPLPRCPVAPLPRRPAAPPRNCPAAPLPLT